MKSYSKAMDDLNEAKEIAELGSMKLFLCDYHLEAGKLYQELEGKEQEAERHFKIAADMIEETKYYRRKSQITNSKLQTNSKSK